MSKKTTTPGQYGVRGILILFKGGEVVDLLVGVVSRGRLESLMQGAL